MKKVNKPIPVIKGRQKAVIESALKLINSDLKTIRPKEMAELAQMLHNTFGVFTLQFNALNHYYGEPQKMRPVYREIWAELRELQTRLKGFFDNMMATVRQQKSDEKLRREIEEEFLHAPPIARYSVSLEITLDLEYEPDSTEIEEYQQDSRKNDPSSEFMARGFFRAVRYPWPFGERNKYSIKISSRATSQEEQVLYEFITALGDIPLAALCTCAECGKWFLHTTNKKRLFCSSQCRARKGSRESYRNIKATNPKKYKDVKDKGKARADKSYRKKIGLD